MPMVSIGEAPHRAVQNLVAQLLSDLNTEINEKEAWLKTIIKAGPSRLKESQDVWNEIAQLKEIHRHVTVTGVASFLIQTGLGAVNAKSPELRTSLLQSGSTRGRPRLEEAEPKPAKSRILQALEEAGLIKPDSP